MPIYKLTYANYRGFAEPIRLIFSQAGVAFEDVRLDYEKEFPIFKQKTPMGQLPVLEVDGKILSQSVTICRYLAKEFNLAGKSAWEQAQADMIVDGAVDCRTAGGAYWMARFRGDAAKQTEARNAFKESTTKFLETYTKLLQQNKSGWFVGDSVTWADLFVANFIANIESADSTLLDAFPLIKQHHKKVFSLPKIAAWVTKRPDTKF